MKGSRAILVRSWFSAQVWHLPAHRWQQDLYMTQRVEAARPPLALGPRCGVSEQIGDPRDHCQPETIWMQHRCQQTTIDALATSNARANRPTRALRSLPPHTSSAYHRPAVARCLSIRRGLRNWGVHLGVEPVTPSFPGRMPTRRAPPLYQAPAVAFDHLRTCRRLAVDEATRTPRASNRRVSAAQRFTHIPMSAHARARRPCARCVGCRHTQQCWSPIAHPSRLVRFP